MTNAARNTPETTRSTGTSTLLAGKDVNGFSLKAPMVDVRGWNVIGPDGTRLGTVDRFMLDRAEQKPRYLSLTPLDGKGHVLLPIGLGTLAADRNEIRLNTLKPETVKALPVLESDVVTADFERKLYSTITGKADKAQSAAQWYADPVFDPMKLFGGKAPAQHS